MFKDVIYQIILSKKTYKYKFDVLDSYIHRLCLLIIEPLLFIFYSATKLNRQKCSIRNFT